jgi:hypothetical protein
MGLTEEKTSQVIGDKTKEPMVQMIRARLGAVKASRDEYVRQVGQQITAYNAVIGELEHLLNPVPEPAPEQDKKKVMTKRRLHPARSDGALNRSNTSPRSDKDITQPDPAQSE